MNTHKYPPPGKLVDIGGYRLHILCRGQGSPTVVMDSAFGGFASDWSLVQPEIAKFTRVCAYDRSGYAWSEPNPKETVRTAGNLSMNSTPCWRKTTLRVRTYWLATLSGA